MDNDIKYCVTALIDLQGFSKHIEVGADLRTSIGGQAIQRLKAIETAITKIKKEEKDFPEFYPKGLYMQRINDALILTLDLDEFLKPRPGETYKAGITTDELEANFDISKYSDDENAAEFMKDLRAKTVAGVIPLAHFVGLITRVHNFINVQESKEQFPGVKTVIASGFRKVFYDHDNKEDFLAANFSFTNAYIAEKSLHGPHLYADCNIIRLLCNDKHLSNVMKASVFVQKDVSFNPFTEKADDIKSGQSFEESKSIEIHILHKLHHYRQLNPVKLSCLQVIPKLSNFLKGGGIISSTSLFREAVNYITKDEISLEEAKSSPWLIYNAMETPLDELYEFLISKKQIT